MEDMSPEEEAAYFGAPALADAESRLRYIAKKPISTISTDYIATACADGAAELASLRAQVEQLTKERDEARKARENALKFAAGDREKANTAKVLMRRLETERDEALCLAEGPSTLLDLARGSLERGMQLARAQQQVARLKAALEPFARVPATGKRGGAFVIAHAVYTDMTGRRSAPRSAYWHWKDFERAREALTTEKADG